MYRVTGAVCLRSRAEEVPPYRPELRGQGDGNEPCN